MSFKFLFLGSFVITALVVLLTLNSIINKQSKTINLPTLNLGKEAFNKDDNESLSFVAVGDFGATKNTEAVLNRIKSSDSKFTLALGDLSYGQKSEDSWCDMVKSILGEDYPFELVSGNHDQDGTKQGHINNLINCLPNKMVGLAGEYGKSYYFDYQDLARFILISPSLTLDGKLKRYSKASPEYQELKGLIDEGKKKNLPWIIVGMHIGCLSASFHPCEISPELINLLIENKVDLILQAHDHSYQRSKQLQNNTSNCPKILVGQFNLNCVADDGSDGVYLKNKGSVIVISGTGGHSLYNIEEKDPEKNYFAKLMGANLNPSFGFTKFSLTKQEIYAEFIDISGSSQFSDQFLIK